MNQEELFDKHLRGELSPEEAAALKQLLSRDKEAGRAFVEHVNESTLLVRVGTQLQSARRANNVVPLPGLESRPESRPPFWRRPRTWAAAAACVAMLAALAFVLAQRLNPPRVADVAVTGAGVQVLRAGSILDDDMIELRPGDIITSSTNASAVVAYEREETRIEIFPGGVLAFEGAAQGKQFELRRGVIQARVARQPADQPMSVKTAFVRATVLGTEFVMRAEDRATRLDVIEGKVKLACRASGRKVVLEGGFTATSCPKAPFNVAPLCSSNCILRECRGGGSGSNSKASENSKTSQEIQSNR